ncbi:exodeoxyribonuclease V subunit alpha [Solemya velesiana gill symbiont]|uniref:RecBCD enzyme subunit RecD n=1 Tax=Solemya velesiana gill symbiont TaxID=1918948 RepID=A0A1T2KTA2_9GAMM|nr:exodeoxyribonuclease V subunit alpha [Solemya velesiana gill symbiont]OOZ35960.1 exodeoxyribonuclease V subunit alpha [Solemya velesiana gill symbiont]
MDALDRQLYAFREQQVLTELDLQFARFICRLEGKASPVLGVAAALVSNSTMTGHICLELDEWSGREIKTGEGDEIVSLPGKASWISALGETQVVGHPGDYCPLVMDEKGRLYLYRYWDYEQQLASDLLQRAAQTISGIDEDRLTKSLQGLFPKTGEVATDWQKVAAAVAALKGLSVISGGPGTGKTTTVVRILALLVEQYETPPAIALAAPTGKAAARLQGSIRSTKQRLDLGPATRDAIPEHAVTLHRLLGGGHNAVSFRHNRGNPLPLDVLILDEASMVDLALMSKLLQALPEKARLILLGDRNQLASVEAGAVLGDICGNWRGFSPGFRKELEQLICESLGDMGQDAGPLSDSIVELKHSYRFGSESGIGRLAEAVNQGDAEQVIQLLSSDAYGDILWHAEDESPIEAAATSYQVYLEVVGDGAGVEQVFDAFDRFRVLCATRQGALGVEEMNVAISSELDRRGLIRADHTWYPGRPVLITRNDYNLHLYNGDIGITMQLPDGSLRVCFRSVDETVRHFSPSRLPQHETVFAMTVHKSQGSEFERVLLVLPRADSPILTRELIYTGLTRAINTFEINALQSFIKVAVQRRLSRISGLKERLWEGNKAVSEQLSLFGKEIE